MSNLAYDTAKSFILGIVIIGALIFIPAWTFDYWQGWLFLAAFLIPANALGIYLAITNPILLARRKNVGPKAEKKTSQKIIVSFLMAGCIALLVVSALDHRFGWSSVSPAATIAGAAVVALSFVLYFFVMRENSFSAATIETFSDQKVISSGPYAIVRHPMYVTALIMLAAVPPALGSWWGLLIVGALVPVLVWRIIDEEALLKADLPGYADYTKKVPYRLVPGVW